MEGPVRERGRRKRYAIDRLRRHRGWQVDLMRQRNWFVVLRDLRCKQDDNRKRNRRADRCATQIRSLC
jgi:hypothetical protein